MYTASKTMREKKRITWINKQKYKKKQGELGAPNHQKTRVEKSDSSINLDIVAHGDIVAAVELVEGATGHAVARELALLECMHGRHDASGKGVFISKQGESESLRHKSRNDVVDEIHVAILRAEGGLVAHKRALLFRSDVDGRQSFVEQAIHAVTHGGEQRGVNRRTRNQLIDTRAASEQLLKSHVSAMRA